LRQLVAGNSDAIQNVVVCPNCHPEFPLRDNQAGISVFNNPFQIGQDPPDTS